ncbi:MAG: hypothetical protein GY711_18300 [bacterium]|nr:hypothetical protein [bacterium]
MPLSDIVQGACETNASAVAITVSLASAGPTSFRRLTDLRRALPKEIDLIVGGDGARRYRRSPAGTQVLHSIADAQRWLRSLRRTVDRRAHGESA